MGPGLAIIGALAALSAPAPAHCPAGVPVQQITVVNQAGVRPFALAKVERAVSDQSLQLRAAWGTPCVQFGAGGWPVYVRIGGTEWGAHYADPTRGVVYTAGLTYRAWSQALSHEVVEMLVDPTTTNDYYAGEKTIAVTDPVYGDTSATEALVYPIEVADPVGERGYRLDGVWVSDFVLPAWFAGSPTVPAAGCDPAQGVQCGPPVAAADAPGPYDEMGILSGPWQTQWERPGT